jgi:hypothetical protein
MRKAIYYKLYTPGRTYSDKGTITTLEVESVWTSPRGKNYCTLIFVDKSYKSKEYVKREDVIYIAARCELLPDTASSGMLYNPRVINPYQIYNSLWNTLYKSADNTVKRELIKLDNRIFSWTKTQQDLFILEGLRFDEI